MGGRATEGPTLSQPGINCGGQAVQTGALRSRADDVARAEQGNGLRL
jgi:hypothetical protein